MRESVYYKKHRPSLGLCLNLGLAAMFGAAGLFLVYSVHQRMDNQALKEADSKALLLLNRNLATHNYFTDKLKPAVFDLTDPYRPDGYFDPTWMSSTYAVRHIENEVRNLSAGDDFYYKECAINARSPQNEADGIERAFLAELRRNPDLQFRSSVRNIDGQPYYVAMRRGENTQQSCLRCHGDPGDAPAGLVEKYGPDRSFGRKVGEVASAISIRAPLAAALSNANTYSRELAWILVLCFVGLFAGQMLLYRLLAGRFLQRVYNKAMLITNSDKHLGEHVREPYPRELNVVARTFNAMSSKVKEHMDNLERQVAERTRDLEAANERLQGEVREREKTVQDLQQALSEIKTLRGIVPICAFCKQVRDDQGYWNQVEAYVRNHTEAEFSHAVCPECMKKHYPEFADDADDEEARDANHRNGDQ